MNDLRNLLTEKLSPSRKSLLKQTKIDRLSPGPILANSQTLIDANYFADELRVGDVPLQIGESMIFHYDFGDDWRFKVTLESVDETNSGKLKTPKVTEKSGAAPKQYEREDW